VTNGAYPSTARIIVSGGSTVSVRIEKLVLDALLESGESVLQALLVIVPSAIRRIRTREPSFHAARRR
jgi:hypothetical protein